ncbi:armadillo-type protein [Lobosporangium transversale]|uniref:Armadillo-type protein n=1 Tax=Lobosporangium transversale TaxID=64571 RepID=A0A1Y2H3C8_9FUNG|nr:armadillo-type protein [Lobosporangium transversale]ORZ29060.1 armadillo-type protein [Lobosporangium transversale]|eukprot:XP_021886733.1 armadillo-type protein [Lobosporangium transversale]
MFGDPELPPVEKARLLSKSDYDFHRAFLAREVVTLLPSMDIGDAISSIVPIVRELSADSQESVRESLASQLDKIVLYFYQNAIITDEKALTDTEKETKDANTPHQPSNSAALAHNTFTPIFINLLLDQNAAIAHQTREAVRSVAENCREDLLESEVLDGVIAGLEKLYNNSSASELKQGLNMNGETDQDGEAELGKMLVVVLLTSLAKTLGKDRCTQIVLPKLEKLMSNSQFFVRKEIVIALGTLCKVVDQRVVIDKLLPLYDTFVHDDTWHIRRACCTVLASFVSSLPVEMKTKKVEEIYDLYSVDVSRSVRNSIMEVLGEVIAGFEEGKVPDSLLNHFLNMGQQPMNEHELAVMCAFSFPAVILTAGRSKWEMMKPVYMKLAATFRSPIRRSLACSLHEVARILGPEIADRDLAVAFSDCLVAEDEVKEGVIGHVVEFISCLSPQCRSYALRNIYNAWSELERSSNWRLRDSLAGQLPALCEIAEAKDLLEYLMPLSIRACTDGVSTIRESGVMSFPALWEVSSRVGPVVHKKEKEDNDVVMEDSEDLGPVLGSFGEGEDLDMEDVTNQLYNPPHSSQAGQIDSATKTNGSISSTNTSGQERTTTIKEQVVQQTIEFINNGGFRSRVVAVQIIQSLLDYGIDIEDFEEHFLLPLVEQLATDNVVNVRIWVSRVITWIIESGLCKESANISDRLQTTLLILQKDPDRDVRIYAGGPAELPKPKKKKKSSKNKKKKKKDQDQQQSSSSIGGIKNGADRSQVSTINEEDENSEDIKFLKGEGDSDDNNDEDDDDDDDDEEEGESDEESSDDSMEFLNSAKTKGISNKPRNRNSLGIGMKVMVGNKLTVSGKEIRKPKTSWDYVHGEIDEDEDETGDSSQKSFSAALGSKEVQKLRWSENGDDDSEEGGSLFDAPRQPLEHDDDDDPVDPSADISKVVPYNARRADSASPLDVEMEGSGERVSVFVQTGDTLALAGQEPTLDRTRSATQPSTDSLPKPSPAPAVSQYPPLSPMSAPSVEAVSAKTPPSGLSYADSVKQDEANPKSNYEPNQKDVGAVTVEAATTPSASSSASSSNRNGLLLTNASLTARGRSPEEEVLRVLNAKLMATGTGKKAHHPVLPPPITVNTSRKASFGAADPGSPSYAAIVASGASSPHPGILPAMPLPAITAGSNMRPNMNAKFGSS